MVVEGPPGTGKSQTITNLISHFLANGKTVLFVAEKMAALEVVHNRLSAIGLTDFCLELHSTKAKKAEISRQFVALLDHAGTRLIADWDRESERLASLRNELNVLVGVLHRTHSNGLSVYEAIGLTLVGRENPATLEWSDADTHDYKERMKLEDFISNLSVLAKTLSRIEQHPLSEIKKKIWTPSWQESLLGTVNKCAEQVAEIKARLHEFAVFVKMDPSIVSFDQ